MGSQDLLWHSGHLLACFGIPPQPQPSTKSKVEPIKLLAGLSLKEETWWWCSLHEELHTSRATTNKI